MLLLRMLSLGQGAWDMIDSQVFKEPRLVCTAGHLCFNEASFDVCMLCKKIGLNTSTANVCLQDLEVVTRFLPAMMSVVVDDHMFTVEQKLPSEEKSSPSYPITLPDSFNR